MRCEQVVHAASEISGAEAGRWDGCCWKRDVDARFFQSSGAVRGGEVGGRPGGCPVRPTRAVSVAAVISRTQGAGASTSRLD